MSPDEKTALELEREQFETDVKDLNAKLSGVGLRWKAGATRGKATQNIKYLNFDETQPATLPKSFKEFQDVVMAIDKDYGTEASLVEFLITGANEAFYKDASDPIAEYVNPAWGPDVKLQFRTVVRNLAKMQEISIPDAVALVKPGTEKKFLTSQKSA